MKDHSSNPTGGNFTPIRNLYDGIRACWQVACQSERGGPTPLNGRNDDRPGRRLTYCRETLSTGTKVPVVLEPNLLLKNSTRRIYTPEVVSKCCLYQLLDGLLWHAARRQGQPTRPGRFMDFSLPVNAIETAIRWSRTGGIHQSSRPHSRRQFARYLRRRRLGFAWPAQCWTTPTSRRRFVQRLRFRCRERSNLAN